VAQRTFRGAAAELRVKALSLARWAGGQAPHEQTVEEAKDIAKNASENGVSDMFLLSGWEIVGQIVLSLVFSILFGILYKKYKYTHMFDPADEEADAKDSDPKSLDSEWKFAFWDCFATPRMCCIACCFPAIRWADSVDMANLQSFWTAVAMWWVLSLFNLFVGFGFALVTAVLGAYHRQKIRAIFSIESGTPKTIALDFFAYCCCPCVAITQEGRTLEDAERLKHKCVRKGTMESPR